VVGIALFGIAIAVMFVTLKPPTPRDGDANNV
jgi:hypothetical protein